MGWSVGKGGKKTVNYEKRAIARREREKGDGNGAIARMRERGRKKEVQKVCDAGHRGDRNECEWRDKGPGAERRRLEEKRARRAMR